MTSNLMKLALEAHKRSFQRALEIAVRTGTALVFNRNGKTVEIKPPYRYELISTRGKKTVLNRKKNKQLGMETRGQQKHFSN